MSLPSTDPKNQMPGLTAYQERHIFYQIIALQRVYNSHNLSHWALTQTMAYYMYGVRATVVNSSWFEGTTVGTSFRNVRYTIMLKGLAYLYWCVLERHLIADYTHDNVTTGEHLNNSRGTLSMFLHGTHMVVHTMHPYTRTDYDHLRVDNIFNQRQAIIPPGGMQRYNDIKRSSSSPDTTAFMEHGQIPKGNKPGVTRKICAAHTRL